jgi:hypothetical protein
VEHRTYVACQEADPTVGGTGLQLCRSLGDLQAKQQQEREFQPHLCQQAS